MSGGKCDYEYGFASVRSPSGLWQKRCERCPTRARGAGVRGAARGVAGGRADRGAGGRWVASVSFHSDADPDPPAGFLVALGGERRSLLKEDKPMIDELLIPIFNRSS